MEWTFDQLRKLTEKAGLEVTQALLVSPPRQQPVWDQGLTFNLVGKLSGVRFELLDNDLVQGKHDKPYLRLSLSGNFFATEPLPEQNHQTVEKALQTLLAREDVKKVVAGGGLDKVRDRFWEAVADAVKKAGGEASAKWDLSGKLSGYGKYKGSTDGVEASVHLERNKEVFHTLKVNLLDCDFAATAKEVVRLLKEKQEDAKKKKKNTPLYERLNELGVTPVVEDGKVTALVDENGEALRVKELEELGLDPENLGSVQPHPEGADRGGYLPEVGGAQYDENSGEWQ